MPDRVVELRYPGQPNPTFLLPTPFTSSLWSLLERLDKTTVPVDGCWRRCVGDPDLLVSRGEGVAREFLIISDEFVITASGSYLDSQLTVRRQVMSQVSALMLQDLTWSIAPHPPADAGWRRCDHPPGTHAPDYSPCGCGSPDDADRWLPMAICESSNCFNYAVKDVWCRWDAVSVGATPRGTPDDPTSYDEWADILAPDGIVPATLDVAPSGLSGGWHIALLVDGPVFHFLRLDGEFWTHKYGPRPPQTCDARGARIPKFGIDDAALCRYELVGYFYVPTALRIDHY